MEVLIEENKNLRNQLSQKIYNSSENESNNQQDKNLVESLKQQIIELKKKIMEKDLELEEKRNENIRTQKDDLNNIIINNSKNIEQLKMTYQLLIDDKDNRIKELEEEIISYEKEIDLLKEENDKLKSESRKDKILSEAEVNNLKNQKIELQCLLEQGNSNNNLINLNKDDKEKIKKMENELNIKNKQITLLTQNHENDLKELNLAIEMLKQKIIQLEEENYNLSLEKNKAIEKNE
jgi:chromosome segregation protein